MTPRELFEESVKGNRRLNLSRGREGYISKETRLLYKGFLICFNKLKVV